MRYIRWQEKDLTLFNGDVTKFTVLDRFEHDIAFELVEEFFTRVDMVIGSSDADNHRKSEFRYTSQLPTGGLNRSLCSLIQPC